jgi:inositol-phosphate phosphatase / L-galactose 1-phosphate phosphatase / histidinol-phosphatase
VTAPVDETHLAFADRLADAAGEVARRYFRRKIAIDDKADTTPVTVADREAEAAMRRLIAERFPEHGILGEEHGAERLGADFLWVLDPIDGTKSFISGVPLFGTLIALLFEGRPVLGIIDQPISRERWRGLAGTPSTLNGERIATRPCPELGAATLFAGAVEQYRGADQEALTRLRARVKLTRHNGDCYAYGLVALGFVDLVAEASMRPYDYCALVPVIEGAGGVITDWQNRALGVESDGRVLAAGAAHLHQRAREVLAG